MTGPVGSQGPVGLTGSVGATGAAGPQGPLGPAGPQGPVGASGTNGTGFNFRNAFDPSASYAVDDVATYNGSTYVAIAVNQGPNNPTPDLNSAAWSLMALAGAAGPTGTTGAQGTQGPAGLAGATGAIGATGAQGPIGPVGPVGPAGANGTNGSNGTGFNFRNVFDPSASYPVDDVATYNGSTYVAIATNQGPNNTTPDVNAAWT